MNVTPEQIRWVFVYLFVLIISIALHELGHALMATRLGDDTPRRQGRVTLNPLAHADPIGTFLLPLIGGLYGAATGHAGGFGWGKPVQWQPNRINRKWSMTTAKILVAVAGPSMNLLLGSTIAFVNVLLLAQGAIALGSQPDQILQFAAITNFVLFFFNLLPIPPLDGGHVAENLMPYKYRQRFDNYARYAPFLLVGVMLIPQLQRAFQWPALWCTRHVYSAFASILM